MHWLGELPQLAANGIMAGAVLALAAIGFTMIYAVQRFPNFAVSGHMAVGAYAGWLLNTAIGVPLPIAAAAAFLVAGLVGVGGDFLVLRPIRRAAPITLAIASVSLAVLLENAVRFVWGNALRSFDLPLQRDLLLGGLRLNPLQMQSAALAVLVMALLFALFAFTQTGRVLRATADDPALASVKGIDTERVTRLIVFLGMGLAGLAGVLLGADTSVDPQLGLRVVLAVFAAAVVGGLGSIPGAVLGAFAVGMAEELSQVAIPSTYKGAVGFFAILVFLTLRPSGLLGARRL